MLSPPHLLPHAVASLENALGTTLEGHTSSLHGAAAVGGGPEPQAGSLPKGLPVPGPSLTHPSLLLPLLQQIDELLAGSFTQEDEDAILEELDAITQV